MSQPSLRNCSQICKNNSTAYSAAKQLSSRVSWLKLGARSGNEKVSGMKLKVLHTDGGGSTHLQDSKNS